MYRYILSGGQIIDGSGAAAYAADLGIEGERITAIGDLRTAESSQVLDVQGMVIAPGFIDVHNHSDGWLFKIPRWDIKLRQGFTTEILMSDGVSYAPLNDTTAPEWFYYLRSLNGLEQEDYRGWKSIGDYLQLLHENCLQNFIAQVPYANVRTLACGFGSLSPSASELKAMRNVIRQELDDGACALSTGLEYLDESLASTDELIECCREFAQSEIPYVTHIRYPLGLIEGVREAVEICERAQVPLHVSHLKASTPKMVDSLIEFIDREARQRVDFSFDVYPYSAASTMLHYLLPYTIWTGGARRALQRVYQPEVQQHFAQELAALDLTQTYIAWVESDKNQEWIGKSLADYCQQRKLSAVESATELLVEENLSVLLVFRRGGDEIVHPFLAHESFMLGSDAVYFPNAAVHPRCFGSSARLLGPCVRNFSLFSLEKAVEKMTSIPAKRFGIAERGVLSVGNYADITVFDPRTITDRATYDDPNLPPEGIEAVFVNGALLVHGGKTLPNTPLAGKYLRRSASSAG